MLQHRVKAGSAFLLLVPLLAVLPGPAAGPAPQGPAESPLPAGAFARLGTSRLRHAPVTTSLAFTPDGKSLYSASFAGTLCTWDVATGKQTRMLANIGPRFALSADGRVLATTASNGQIVLRQPATGQQTAVLAGHSGEVTCLALSADGKKLMSGGKDRTVRLWDVEQFGQLWSSNATGEVRWVALSRDGKRGASASEDKLVQLWDTASGDRQRDLEGHASKVTCVEFTPDSKFVVSVSWDRTARVWDVASGKQTRSYLQQGGAEALAISPDGKYLAVHGGGDSTLYMRELAADKDKVLWKGNHPQGFRLAFTRDSKMIASGGWDSTIRLWDVATGKRLPADLPPSHEGWVYGVATLPDGNRIVCADSGGQVLLWDIARQTVLGRFAGHTGRVLCVACSRDGKTVATGGTDKKVRVFETASGKLLRTIEVRGQVRGLDFSPDGKRLASAVGPDRYSTWMGPIQGDAAQVWNPATGDIQLTLSGVTGGAKAIAFAPDGKTLATAGNDGTVRIFDAAGGKERLTLKVGKGAVETVAFSPDGELIAATGQDELVSLWRTMTGEKVWEVKGPRGWGLALAFSPDGRVLGSTAAQETIYGPGGVRQPSFPVRLWEVATGKERARFAGHQGTAHALAFQTDGTALITGGADGTVLLWDLTGRRIGVAPVPAATAWANLLDADGAAVQRGIWSLVAQPKTALPLLRAGLKPVARGQEERVARLIKDLDDDNFKVRAKAWRELEAIGEPAVKALREALKSSSAEVRDRAEQLLEKVQGKERSPEQLRQVRALEVLEHLDHPEALALLEALAKGAPGAHRTKQASEILQRKKKSTKGGRE
jgi:WD40 repeat protein